MRARCCRAFPISLSIFVLAACGGSQDAKPRVATSPVNGEVTVDGNAAENVIVSAVAEKLVATTPDLPKTVSVQTDKDGKFHFSTYTDKDGLPLGDFALTVSWPDPQREAGERRVRRTATTPPIPDRLNNRYDSLEKSPKKFAVERGKPVNLGKLELTTQ